MLVLALAQPVGRAVWAVALLQAEGPHYLQPLANLTPSFWQIPSQLVLTGITESRLSSSPLGPGADLAPAAQPQIPRGSHL